MNKTQARAKEHRLTCETVTWTDAWELWLAYLDAAPYAQRLQAWHRLQQVASLAGGHHRTERVQWPECFRHLTPELVMGVMEELG